MTTEVPTALNNSVNDVNDLITNDVKLQTKLTKIGEIFNGIKEDKILEFGAKKTDIMKTWIGDSVETIDNEGLVDTQVKELYETLTTNDASQEDIKTYIGKLLTEMETSLSSVGIVSGEDNDISNTKLNSQKAHIEDMDNDIFTEYQLGKAQEKIVTQEINEKLSTEKISKLHTKLAQEKENKDKLIETTRVLNTEIAGLKESKNEGTENNINVEASENTETVAKTNKAEVSITDTKIYNFYQNPKHALSQSGLQKIKTIIGDVHGSIVVNDIFILNVKKYQKANSLTADGKIGKNTLQKMVLDPSDVKYKEGDTVEKIVETARDVGTEILDSTEKLIDSAVDFTKESGEKIVKLLQEVLDIDTTIGELYGFENVKIEYDEDRKKIEIDTPFFDGIDDYDSCINLKDIDLSSEEAAKISLKTIMTKLVTEYQKKLDNEVENQKITIVENNIDKFDLKLAERKITRKGTFNHVDIGSYKNGEGETEDIVLKKDGIGNFYIELDNSTGFGSNDFRSETSDNLTESNVQKMVNDLITKYSKTD
ncbi:MAG: peptidoglycan-binding protein [Candidatus Gracilibacteria bacterium]|nr:peptidoglycan-binding protein [Candidatus Gracilibacteria bacterium]